MIKTYIISEMCAFNILVTAFVFNHRFIIILINDVSLITISPIIFIIIIIFKHKLIY